MSQKINSLLNQYVLWPELKNDYQDNIHFGNVSLEDFHKEIQPLIGTTRSIDTSIATFYIANEMVADIRKNSQDVLSEKDIEKYNTYQKVLGQLSKELISYILVCSIVEARHNEDFIGLKRVFREEFLYNEFLEEEYTEEQKEEISKFAAKLDDVKKISDIVSLLRTQSIGQKFLKYHFSMNNDESEESFNKFLDFKVSIREKIKMYLNDDDDEDGNRNSGYTRVADNVFHLLKNYTLEEALNNLTRLFAFSDFPEGYGGVSWSEIARHGLNFVTGKINAEMFIDQAFSLEHNNGNMFNKDFLFKRTGSFEMPFHSCSHVTHEHLIRFEVSQLFLNGQHLGNLSGLFSLSPSLHYMEIIDFEDLYDKSEEDRESTESYSEIKGLLKKVKKNPIFDDANAYDFNDFSTHLKTIKKMFRSIHTVMKKVQSHWETSYPDIYNYLQEGLYDNHRPVDFKKLFYQVAYSNYDRSPDHSDLYGDLLYSTDAKEEGINGGYFDLSNELYNNIFKEYYYPNQVINLDNHRDHFNANKKPFAPTIFNLDDIEEVNFNKKLLGGKAWGLVNMEKMHLPVPKAKIFTTDCSHAYFNHPQKFFTFIEDQLKSISTFLTNGEGKPVLCSVRSGAPVSMPGMMDTVLNVGIDDSNYDYFCDTLGKKVTDDCVNKFMELFCSSRLEVKMKFTHPDILFNLNTFKIILKNHNKEVSEHTNFPLTKEKQIAESLYAVFNSWDSDRAVAYRVEKNIPHDLGTAAIIQHMVFGNLNDNSCTGVVFSRNCLTGENTLVGEYLPNAQGEDVVSGARNPYDISKLKNSNPAIYQELEVIAKKLESQTGQIQDIEFTVENGKLYILQHRQAVCSPVAAITLLDDNTLEKGAILSQISPKSLQNNYFVDTQEPICAQGLSANSGVLQGMIITDYYQLGRPEFQAKFQEHKDKNPNFGWIFYAELTSPEHMPIMNQTQGFITNQGGFTSHAAIIARSLNKPCIVGINNDEVKKHNYLFNAGDIVTMDGENGKIWLGLQNFKQNTLAQSGAKKILHTIGVDIEQIDCSNMEKTINQINDNNKSWMFNFNDVKLVNQSPVKTEKFFDLGLKVALVITANEQQAIKQKNINLSL